MRTGGGDGLQRFKTVQPASTFSDSLQILTACLLSWSQHLARRRDGAADMSIDEC